MRSLRPAFAFVAVVATSCGGAASTVEGTAPAPTTAPVTVTAATPSPSCKRCAWRNGRARRAKPR